MPIRPLSNHLLIRRASAEDKIGSLYVPENAKKRPQRGRVVAAGPGFRNPNGILIEPEIQVDDEVLFHENSGVEVVVDGETLVFLTEDAVIAEVIP